MSIPKHKLYKDAEILFVEQGMSCNAISEQLGITEATLSGWRSRMNWDRTREDFLSSPFKIRQLLQNELKWISEGNKPRVDSDALSKVNKALRELAAQVSLPVIISVFKRFDQWMLGIDPDLCIKVMELHKLFLNECAKEEMQK
jgi:transposase-like protein